MKRIHLLSLVLLVSSCSISRTTTEPSRMPQIAESIRAIGTSTPIAVEIPPAVLSTTVTPSAGVVASYEDVRGKDVSLSPLGEAVILTLWFNGTTLWHPDDIPTALKILELGKNPGLGVRKLHAEGITGQGVRVAIIDQNLVTDHPEFVNKFAVYKDFGTKQSRDEGSMHGPAVASLLVGETIGTAPGASLYYAAIPTWLLDAQFYADALNWIIAENAKLPADQKIRVVSVSAAPSGRGSPYEKSQEAWDAAVSAAEAAGILVLDCTSNHGITFACHYSITDQENVTGCVPGFAGRERIIDKTRIYVPASYRTTAEEYYRGEYEYQYDGQGGLSWTTPYLAGVLAMGWQLRPELDAERMIALVFETAYRTPDGAAIIDPTAFIQGVKAEVGP